MARTNRFELVLSDEEFQLLERGAEDAGLSKGAWVRWKLFESVEPITYRATVVDAPKEPSVAEVSISGTFDGSRRFKQLVAQLQGKGMKQAAAEAAARERLG